MICNTRATILLGIFYNRSQRSVMKTLYFCLNAEREWRLLLQQEPKISNEYFVFFFQVLKESDIPHWQFQFQKFLLCSHCPKAEPDESAYRDRDQARFENLELYTPLRTACQQRCAWKAAIRDESALLHTRSLDCMPHWKERHCYWSLVQYLDSPLCWRMAKAFLWEICTPCQQKCVWRIASKGWVSTIYALNFNSFQSSQFHLIAYESRTALLK